MHDRELGERFKFFFFASEVSIVGLNHVRTVVVIYGTHLKDKFAGTLLKACAQDDNYQIFPIAFAIVDSDNDKSWAWFFDKLQMIVLNNSDVVFVSATNVAESWIVVIKEAREFPVVALIEFIRYKIMGWFVTHRDASSNHTENLTPKVVKIIEEKFEASSGFIVRPIDNEEFKIINKEGKSFYVDLTITTSNCFKFRALLIPCIHEVAASVFMNKEVDTLVGEVYSTIHWQNAY